MEHRLLWWCCPAPRVVVVAAPPRLPAAARCGGGPVEPSPRPPWSKIWTSAPASHRRKVWARPESIYCLSLCLSRRRRYRLFCLFCKHILFTLALPPLTEARNTKSQSYHSPHPHPFAPRTPLHFPLHPLPQGHSRHPYQHPPPAPPAPFAPPPPPPPPPFSTPSPVPPAPPGYPP